ALLPEGTAGPQYYIADGGYYDNFGMATALDWLRRVVDDDRDYGKKVRAILMLQIQLSPESTDYSQLGVAAEAGNHSRGWVYATLGPALTLTSVRTMTQKARNAVDFAQLSARLRDKGVCLEQVVLHPDREGPLSWHLSQSELQHVVKVWESDAV